MSDERCEYHRCKDCGGWASRFAEMVISVAVVPWLLMWSTDELRPEWAWMPDLDYWRALAIVLILGIVKPTSMRIYPR